VQEYFLFDPLEEYLTPSFQGFRRVSNRFQQIRPVAGRLPSQVLGLHLERDGEHLRFYNPLTGQRVPTRTEAAEARVAAAEARAEAERIQKDAERDRAETERVRAEAERDRAAAAVARAEAIEVEMQRMREENERLRRALGGRSEDV